MLIYKQETPTLESIREFFYRTNEEFDVPLNQKVDIEEYTLKLFTYATFFVCYDDETIIGMICCYMNRPPQAYISHVCVSSEYQGKGIFMKLFTCLKSECVKQRFSQIALEVGVKNVKAQNIYKKMGFGIVKQSEHSFYLNLLLLNQ